MSVKKSITLSEELFNRVDNYAILYFQGNISACLGYIASRFFNDEGFINSESKKEHKEGKKLDLGFLNDD